MDKRQQATTIIDNITLFIWGLAFLLLPLFFLTVTSESFILPKQILLGIVAFLSLILLGVKTFLNKKVYFRQTILDLPIFVFLIALLLSSLFALNRYDSLIIFVGYFFTTLSYFLITNIIGRKAESAFFLLTTLIVGGCLTAILSLFSYFRVYLFFLTVTKSPSFTPLGSLLDQAIYFFVLLCISGYIAFPMLKGKSNGKTFGFAIATFVLVVGLACTLLQVFTTQKPLLLPFIAGFQIAFAAISQDTPRIAQGFFFGSGIGTFFTDFTRFRPASFNADPTLWFLSFNQSSSFVLELLATTGVIGLLSYLFIIGRTFQATIGKYKNPLFFAVVLLFIISFILPFSFTTSVLFFAVLAIFSSIEGFKNPEKAFDMELSVVALKKSLTSNEEHVSSSTSPVLPLLFCTMVILIVGVVGFFATRFVISDITFTNSLAAAATNNGIQTYQQQVSAINMFPYRDSYYRTFSQTNMALANSILTLATSKGASPSSQAQQTALSLIQQSITTARTAITLAPLTSLNYQNLSSVYRAIIVFGQGADTFSIQNAQQAIALDPNNPQEYLTLGGLYYQLGQWDNAIREFQIVISLKSDYANGYYNLGHAYEQKGDYQDALTNYQTVASLMTNDPNNKSKIDAEIAVLQQKIGSQQAQQNNGQTTQTTNSQRPTANSQTQTPQEPLTLPGSNAGIASPTPTGAPQK